MIGVVAWVVRMGLRLLVGSAMGFFHGNTCCRERESSKKFNCVGTTGVLGMSCTLGDVAGVADSGSVSGGTLGGAAGVT